MTQKIISVFSSAYMRRSSRAEKVEARDNLVKAALDKVLDDKLVFESKKRLLAHIAKFISTHEHELLAKSLDLLPDNISQGNVTVGGLYKSETYMARVDSWLLNNPKAVKKANVQISKKTAQMRLQLTTLSNQNERLKLDLYQTRNLLLSIEVDKAEGERSPRSTDLHDAYFIIDALLLEFGEFVSVDATGISVNNSLRRLLVGAEPISGYLKWRGRVIETG